MGNMSPACMLASLCAQQWNMSVITYHCIDTPLEAACLTGVHCIAMLHALSMTLNAPAHSIVVLHCSCLSVSTNSALWFFWQLR